MNASERIDKYIADTVNGAALQELIRAANNHNKGEKS
jgi:hypothetical protein